MIPAVSLTPLDEATALNWLPDTEHDAESVERETDELMDAEVHTARGVENGDHGDGWWDVEIILARVTRRGVIHYLFIVGRISVSYVETA